MIAGVGNDIIEIHRIEKAVSKNDRFILRNFTKREQDYFRRRNNSYETIAGNFAAKEAVSKALGTGFKGFDLVDVEVIRDEEGAPLVCLHGKAREISKEKNIGKIWVSISHCKEYASAVAIAEKGL
ncbi:MAG: holo-ACP synthase [Epulopiscium sp.]|nr:holo-ACP synthase [Candidatus Epulonipiscium sp.]